MPLGTKLYAAKTPGAPLICLLADAGEGDEVRARLTDAGADVSLAVIDGLDWNRDLSPWPAPAVFKGGEAFSGGADGTIEWLLDIALPDIEARLSAPPAWRGLAGYSLAGLAAVYALYRTDRFDRIMCASGSLWFPGFEAFAVDHAPARLPDRLYLSLGDREARTRNPAMAPVEAVTRRLAAHWQGLGVETLFELNPGNHFADPAERMAKGMKWVMGMRNEE